MSVANTVRDALRYLYECRLDQCPPCHEQKRAALVALDELEAELARKTCQPNAFGDVVHVFAHCLDGSRCQCGEAEWRSAVDA